MNQHHVLKPTLSPARSQPPVWGDGLHAWPFLSLTGRPRETWPGALLNSKCAASVHTMVSVMRRSHRGPGILIQPGAFPGQDRLDAKNRNKTNHTVKDNTNGKICAVTPRTFPGSWVLMKIPRCWTPSTETAQYFILETKPVQGQRLSQLCPDSGRLSASGPGTVLSPTSRPGTLPLLLPTCSPGDGAGGVSGTWALSEPWATSFTGCSQAWQG